MIHALLLATLQPSATPLPVAESRDPGSKSVVVCAALKMPDLGPEDQLSLPILGKSLMQGTRNYTREEIQSYGGQDGVAPTVTVCGRWLILTVQAPGGKEGMNVAIDVISEMIKVPNLFDDQVSSLIEAAKSQTPSTFDLGVYPIRKNWTSVSVARVKRLYDERFVRSRLQFLVSGNYPAGSAGQAIEDAFAYWAPKESRPADQSKADVPLVDATRGGFAVWSLTGKPVPSTPDRMAALALALAKLGVGKSSSLFQIAREQERLCYQSMAFAWPSLTGWEPRIAALSAPDRQSGWSPAINEIKLQLENLTDQDLLSLRAKVTASIEGKSSYGLFFLGPDDSLDGSIRSRTIWEMLSVLMGRQTSLDEFRESLNKVPLADVKSEALDLITQTPHWIPDRLPGG
ncbi:MAG: insulinase family protein [Armatimonadetes bacterium]|nr:insulinase family protein [Armatimonadota bacterium]